MNKLSKEELLLMSRALVLLSCVVEGKDSETCLKLAGKAQSELQVRVMLQEDEQRGKD